MEISLLLTSVYGLETRGSRHFERQLLAQRPFAPQKFTSYELDTTTAHQKKDAMKALADGTPPQAG
jgi:hypothetical protein